MGENINIQENNYPYLGDRVLFKSQVIPVITGIKKDVFEGVIIAAESSFSEKKMFLVRIKELEGFLHNGDEDLFNVYSLEESVQEPKNDLWIVSEENILEII